MKNSKCMLICIFGVVSFLLGPAISIPTIIYGHSVLRQSKQKGEFLPNKWQVVVGIILAYIGIINFIVIIFLLAPVILPYFIK